TPSRIRPPPLRDGDDATPLRGGEARGPGAGEPRLDGGWEGTERFRKSDRRSDSPRASSRDYFFSNRRINPPRTHRRLYRLCPAIQTQVPPGRSGREPSRFGPPVSPTRPGGPQGERGAFPSHE